MPKKIKIRIYSDKEGHIDVRDTDDVEIPWEPYIPEDGQSVTNAVFYWSKNSPGCVNFVILGKRYRV